MGDNCGVKDCHLNRKRLNGNNYISFHNILLIEDEEWRKKLLHKLGRDFSREAIPLKDRKGVFICSRHFDEKCIKRGEIHFV
jgi:hypothetical protein